MLFCLNSILEIVSMHDCLRFANPTVCAAGPTSSFRNCRCSSRLQKSVVRVASIQ